MENAGMKTALVQTQIKYVKKKYKIGRYIYVL